jgi:polyribonucleotide 5'-hydroxyl-kinase
MASIAADEGDDGVKVWDVPRSQEIRIELVDKKTCTVKINQGNIELFGIELGTDTEYTLEGPCSVALFSWYGAQLTIKGDVEMAYLSSYTAIDTPMHQYINTHDGLSYLRTNARDAGTVGPRVMICGPADSGKSTLGRTLMAYSLRQGHCPIYVNLDVKETNFSTPCTISAAQLSFESINVSLGMIPQYPLVYYFGHTEISENPHHYNALVEELSKQVEERLNTDEKAKEGGVVLTTGAWMDKEGYKNTKKVAKLYNIDLIIVLGDDRLFAQLQNEKDLKGLTVIKLKKSGGAFGRSVTYRRIERKLAMNSYFYGRKIVDKSLDYSPSLQVLSFDDIKLYQIGSTTLNAELLPVGQQSMLDPCQPEPVEITKDLIHSVFGVLNATSEEEILKSCCVGFICVQAIDVGKRTLTLLTPNSTKPPSKFMLLGSFKWIE